MSVRAITAAVLALACAGAMAPDRARADRLEDAGSALREPGVWVADDLAWLVEPELERRLEREIERADVPVRVAVLPHLEIDESRGDPRAIARGIIRSADGTGLYVLVDQDGRIEYAARDLPLAVTASAFPSGGFFDPEPLPALLRAVVATTRSAPAAAATSFEPFAAPKGVFPSGGGDEDSLVGIALITAVLGLILGGLLHLLLRGAALAAGHWRARA